ncbi:hypothetical protein V5F72_24130 [Xanthobacter flavus]|uniref:hypothetical protein n=1 Tax=Xanthobacter flavus TaxID=281 RepID=UPI0037273F80
MDVRFRFPLVRPIEVEDAWPLEGFGATLELERADGTASAITITFKNQPISAAPHIAPSEGGETVATIKDNDHLESFARQILQRFIDYINLYYTIDVSFDNVEASYTPTSDEERSCLNIFRFKKARQRQISLIPFSIIGQAFYAGEADSDPSYVSMLGRLAKENLLDGQYIESFRYSFLLFESLYGNGKFKSSELERELCNNVEFMSYIISSIGENRFEAPRFQDKRLIEFTDEHKTPGDIVKTLIKMRGYYFHGNLKQRRPWHPRQQEGANGIAAFSADVVLKILSSFASPMFADHIGDKYLKNAVAQGAAMTVNVHVNFLDENNMNQTHIFSINTPGTIPTNDMALKLFNFALTKFQDKFPVYRIISIVGTVEGSNIPLFSSNFFISSTT